MRVLTALAIAGTISGLLLVPQNQALAGPVPQSCLAGSGEFDYTPAGVVPCIIETTGSYVSLLFGANGGLATGPDSGSGGMGASASAIYTLTPGPEVGVLVGGAGGGSTSGGAGGGGASFVEILGTPSNIPLVIAGGGSWYCPGTAQGCPDAMFGQAFAAQNTGDWGGNGVVFIYLNAGSINVPEPASGLLLMSALAGVWAMKRRSRSG
jgi:hypothetical protein